jgi:hypothetical protein
LPRSRVELRALRRGLVLHCSRRPRRIAGRGQEARMWIVLLLVGIAGFALLAAFAHACDRM